MVLEDRRVVLGSNQLLCVKAGKCCLEIPFLVPYNVWELSALGMPLLLEDRRSALQTPAINQAFTVGL